MREFSREVQIAAPLESVFDALLEELGPAGELPDGEPLSRVIEPWTGGRWYQKLDDDVVDRLWGHVRVIEPPTLLEIWGPMCLSNPLIGLLRYRLTPFPEGTLLELTFRAVTPLRMVNEPTDVLSP